MAVRHCSNAQAGGRHVALQKKLVSWGENTIHKNLHWGCPSVDKQIKMLYSMPGAEITPAVYLGMACLEILRCLQRQAIFSNLAIDFQGMGKNVSHAQQTLDSRGLTLSCAPQTSQA